MEQSGEGIIQEQLKSLREQVRQAGSCPACGKMPQVCTARDMFNLQVYEIVCDCGETSSHMAYTVVARWQRMVQEQGQAG